MQNGASGSHKYCPRHAPSQTHRSVLCEIFIYTSGLLYSPEISWTNNRMSGVRTKTRFFSVFISRLCTTTLPPDLDLHWIMTSDNLISLSGSTERRSITLRGEHPLRRRAALGVLPDRRGGKINRRLLSLCFGEIRRFLYLQPAPQFEWWAGCVCVTAVCLCVEMCHRCANMKLSHYSLCFHVVFKLGARCCSLTYPDNVQDLNLFKKNNAGIHKSNVCVFFLFFLIVLLFACFADVLLFLTD